MRSIALHILSILLLAVGMATTARAQSKIKIHGNVYGGGDQAAIGGNTTVTINKGEYGGSIYGGGNGALNNDGTVKASADIGTHNDDGTLKEGTGATNVTINGGEIVYYLGDENNFRNIYGGGNAACNVAGSTNVTMKRGMITTYSFTSSPLAMAAWRYFYDNSMKPNQQKTPICSVFGAGYGAHTDVAGNTNVNIDIPGDANIKPADGIAFTHAELEAIDHLGLRLKPDTKLSEQFVPAVHGGGFDGTVGAYDATTKGIKYDKTTYDSQANITIQGQPFVFNVYGGGLGSKSGADATGGVNSYVGAVYGATKVDIQGGLYNGNVFGGGAGIESEQDIPNPFGGAGTIKMPYTYAAQVMRETDVTISGNTTVIFGNVYGGGDIANTGWYYESARPTLTGHQAQQNHSLATLDYTTSLKLNGGNILGSVFGGGNGRTKAQMTMSMFVGTVCGSTNVSLNGTKVWSHVYGGGNMGTVFTCQTIAASKSDTPRAMATGVIDGCTNVAILNGMVAKDIFGGGFGDDPGTGDANVTSADVYGNTYVYFENADLEYSKYWKPREFLPSDATDEQMLAEVTGQFLDQSSAGPNRNTESDITHNLYGGGNMACDVKGNAHVYMIGAPIAPADFSKTDYYKECIENVAKPHFSVFGGGFGNKAMVTGNVYSDINLQKGTGLHSIVGGGLNGTVGGMCNVHVGNDPMSLVHFVYGGGYYAPCAGTKLDITRGTILENVYGGAVMGNIHAAGASTEVATNTTIGLKSEGAKSSVVLKDEFDNTLRSYTYADYEDASGHHDGHKNLITIYGDVYGGNDVSGTVNGIAQLTVYGGEIKGNVYGAGNGNHIGYYIPGALKYDLGTHSSDNYFEVDHKDPETGVTLVSGKTYVGRPQTIGGVNLTLEGNTKDERVKVLGQVFGGGNSCTIGAWDKDLLAAKGDDPHLVRDDPDYFLGGGTLDINLGSHVTIGRTHEQLLDAADKNTYIDNDENVSGLFMGCSGKDLATQTGAYNEDNYYHHFFDYKAKRYYPGFAVGTEAGASMTREEQLKPFQAYLNNIMVWSDNVHLNIPDAAEDIWLANFVGGGFRGSMRAKTLENGRFDYTLPEGVTVSHTIVGGAYNAHVQYRVFATNDDGTFKDEDGDGKYDYLTVVPGGWTPMDPANPTAECDYIKTLHEDEDDPEKITGILRYNFNGGMLSINSTGVSSSPEGRHIHQVHADPRANEAEYATSYFEPMTAGSTDPNSEDEATRAKLYSANKHKTLLHLTLKCALEPEVLPKNDGSGKNYAHGGNVFGGCFMSGFVEGDSWVDYHCWLAPKCAQSTEDKYKYFFDKNDNMHIYDDAGDLETNNALSVYGAGYGADTHSDGDVYLYIKSIAHQAHGDADPAGMFPYIYNAFGGSNMGTVAGNTNVYYAVGKQGTLLGSLYGGGYKGVIEGNTFVELAEGFAHNVYGGSRQADIHGAAHVWAYDGKARGITNANHLIICNLYGGNDIAGTISGTMPATFTATKWNAAPHGTNIPRPDLAGKRFNTYVEISADDNSADRGFPLVGSAFAGGNGEAWEEGDGDKPNVAKALLEIDGGSTLRAFGGGNMATITDSTSIFTNAESDNFANVTFNNYQKGIMTKVFFSGMKSGFRWNENTLTIDPFHVVRLFGGNNLATMDIQPTWNLWKGKLENVYSGGNMGDMTYYNPAGHAATTDGELTTETIGVENNADGTNANYTPRGLSITIDSDSINIKNLFGGCRLSNVVPGGYNIDGITLTQNGAFADCEDLYGATINILDGNIENVYGGNDVGGKVYFGTNINISGGLLGNVYGSGNGDYLYHFDPKATNITEQLTDEYGFYYSVPEKYNDGTLVDEAGTLGSDTHKILTINRIRPAVDNTFINIGGMEHSDGPGGTGAKRVAAVKGNIFMGGNATTITRDGNFTFGKFKLGSYTTINGLFLGSDGYSYTQDEFIEQFAKLNGIDNMGAATSFTTGHDDDASHNPILLNAYLMAVDVQSPPKDFTIKGSSLTEAYIGTFCGGGNRGSMLHDKTVEMDFPTDLVIMDKIVAGCMNATVNYNQNGTNVQSIGGYTRPLYDNGLNGNTKIRYTINSQFKPLVMDAEFDKVTGKNKHNETLATAMAKGFVYDNLNAGDNAWMTGCNIYGGCYESGVVVGDVELNVTSQLLGHMANNGESIFKNSVKDGMDDGVTNSNDRTKFDNALANGAVIGNIYGAGFGQESDVKGNVRIYMTSADMMSPGKSADQPSANNVYGGGRSGELHGNSYIRLQNGHVYSDVVGGCDAAKMYGSTYIGIGRPTYYECKTSDAYNLTRGDQWNGSKIKQTVYYKAGDFIAPNVWSQMSTADQAKFESHNDMQGMDNDKWAKTDIIVRGGVYGGGYTVASSTTGMAGNYTVLRELDGSGVKTNYGGNSTIVVTDRGSFGDDDHIRISTLQTKPVTFTTEQIAAGASTMGLFSLADNKYTHLADGTPAVGTTYYDLSGDGGIYGDGHLTFCEGFRAADISGYGYNTGTVKYPRLLNTFQRLDLLDVNDCCLMLQGAQDFATDKIDATVYSMTRIDELRMNSTLTEDANLTPISATNGSAAAGFTTAKSRNYLGFFNNVHYLGAIVTNDEFTSASHMFRDERGVVEPGKSYMQKKMDFITTYANAANKDADVVDAFKKRNLGTARNCIGINNGFCLRVQNLGTDGRLYYGPIVGVCEVKLLTLTQGEGGGYVYADNVHDACNDGTADHAENTYFLNTSGNFVFPGAVAQGAGIADQYIVDDCFTKHFGTSDAITTKSGELDEAHYWYVEGNKYFYNTTLTGYTYKSPPTMMFDLYKTDPNVVLSGLTNGSSLNVKKVEWLSAVDGFHRGGYAPVLPNTTDGNVDDYEFDFQVVDLTNENNPAITWTTDMPRYTKGDSEHPLTSDLTLSSAATPIFNVKLQDKLDNSGDENYNNHLDEPELVKIYLEGTTRDAHGDLHTYEYTITLNIIYLQGPTYEGGVTIENCALPGERIAFSSGGIKIKTPDLMPVTAASWQILPLSEIVDGEWRWNSNNGVTIPESQYSEDLTGNLSGWIPALYKQHESNIAYIFTAGGEHFPVLPDQKPTVNPLKQNRMIVVHNYHRMKDVYVTDGGGNVIRDLQIEAMPTTVDGHPDFAEAKLYLEDEADLRAFVNYLNMATESNANHIPVGLAGLDIILQNDITLTQSLPAISVPFAGNFHGDGYHIDLSGFGTSFLGANLTGKVYNLGLVGGTIATTGTRTNCYDSTTDDSALRYGMQAYDLSHAFTPVSDAATYDNYVHSRYANGDYQYATSDRVWSLRTGEPWYGHTETRHDCEHTHDADRWTNGAGDDSNPDVLMHKGKNIPLYDGLQVIANRDIHDAITDAVIATKLGIPANYANDYLFFGQHLDRDNGDAFPVHINPIAKGDADGTKGGNRVYKTSGFYGSAADNGFCYNKDAWALQPTLTAIDFTFRNGDEENNTWTKVSGRYDEGDDTSSISVTDDINQPLFFHVDSNADYNADGTSRTGSQPYDNAAYGHVTQNLLVVGENADENPAQAAVLALGTYPDNTSEETVRYHRVQLESGAKDVYEMDYFHLVDKQDFNSPVSLTINTRAWYERYPHAYRNVTPSPTEPTYSTASAWEGITLPFLFTTKVSGEPQTIDGTTYENVLSHFYGETEASMDTNPALNDRTLHHEYWLTGLVGAADGKATFARPTSSSTSGNFYVEGNYPMSYVFQNEYYCNLPDYNNHYDTRDDEGDDVMGEHDKAWYAKEHTFAGYPYQFHGVPYLCAFPGNDFYEFSLEGDDEKGTHDQKITFETSGVFYGLIAVSDLDINELGTTTVNGHSHVGTYTHVTADAQHLGINAEGDAFDVASGHILPFRTYMTTTGASSRRRISIGGKGPQEEIGEEPDEPDPNRGLHVRAERGRIIVTSTLEEERTVTIVAASGAVYNTFGIAPGQTVVTAVPRGIYLVAGRKMAVE